MVRNTCFIYKTKFTNHFDFEIQKTKIIKKSKNDFTKFELVQKISKIEKCMLESHKIYFIKLIINIKF